MESVSGFLSGDGLVPQLAVVILTMIGLQVVMGMIETVNDFLKILRGLGQNSPHFLKGTGAFFL
jgi:hypothetical protein